MALQLFFRGSKHTAPLEEVILLGFIFCFLGAMARVNLQLFLFLVYSSDLLMVELRMSQALCYVLLRFFPPHLSPSLSVRSSWPFAGVWSWQTMPMNDEWWLEVCLVPTECVIQHADSDSCPVHWAHAAVIVSYQWRICPEHITVTGWSGNHQNQHSGMNVHIVSKRECSVRDLLKECLGRILIAVGKPCSLFPNDVWMRAIFKGELSEIISLTCKVLRLLLKRAFFSLKAPAHCTSLEQPKYSILSLYYSQKL